MASLCRIKRFLAPSSLSLGSHIARALSTSACLQVNSSEGWLSKLLHVRKIEPGKDSHSRLLSDTEIVYELQIHDVKPDGVQPYLKGYENYCQLLQSKASDCELIGSWQVVIGDQDQYLHIWRFKQGLAVGSQFDPPVQHRRRPC
ncbi:hypothetical protein MTO96_003018 [Rhipicephalus appendiculatus]